MQDKARYKEDARNWAKKHDWKKIIQRYIDLLQ
jgi:hypothetical protein